MSKLYRDVALVKTGSAAWDWRALVAGEYRWGTVAELQLDIDRAASGIPPKRERGYA